MEDAKPRGKRAAVAGLIGALAALLALLGVVPAAVVQPVVVVAEHAGELFGLK